MKTVFICSPSIGAFDINMAMADSISKIAVNQGHFPVIGSPMLPYQEPLDDLQEAQLSLCDEVWLYYDGRKLRRDILSDLQRAARAGKPVRLVQPGPMAEPWPMAADVYFAADSYADAPGVDDEPMEEKSQAPEVQFAAEPVRINGLLLALKECEELLATPLPSEWWCRTVSPKEDYLREFGVRGLLDIIEALVRQELLPSWPLCWSQELKALKDHMEKWDWTTELPDLDREKLDLVDNNDWHKLGYILLVRENFHRACAFLEEAVAINPGNYLAWTSIAECFFHLGDYNMAHELFLKALTLAPKHYYAWVGLGLCLMATDRFSEAIGMFDQALRVKVDHTSVYVADLREKAVKACSHMFN